MFITSSGFGTSIIIPCYNAGLFLIECVNSIKAQQFKYPHEVIVVDDCSTDKKTIEALNILENRPGVVIIRSVTRIGAQIARNKGINTAKYDYIFMIDADDLLNTDSEITNNIVYTDRAIYTLASCQDVAFVCSTTILFGEENKLINTTPLNEQLVMQRYRVPIGIIYRKNDVLYENPYDDSIIKWQDWSFVVGLLNHRILSGRKNNVKFLGVPYYLYRMHNLSSRISLRNVCERSMLSKTLELYPEIFKIYYPYKSADEIIGFLIANAQKIRAYIPRACTGCMSYSSCRNI